MNIIPKLLILIFFFLIFTAEIKAEKIYIIALPAERWDSLDSGEKEKIILENIAPMFFEKNNCYEARIEMEYKINEDGKKLIVFYGECEWIKG